MLRALRWWVAGGVVVLSVGRLEAQDGGGVGVDAALAPDPNTDAGVAAPDDGGTPEDAAETGPSREDSGTEEAEGGVEDAKDAGSPVALPPASDPAEWGYASPEAAPSDMPPGAAFDVGDDDLFTLRGLTIAHTPQDIFRLGGSAQLLDEAQLDALEYEDPNSVLLQVPGVYVRQEDGFGLRPNIGLRGANSDRSKKITLMEDGVLFAPAPYSAPAAYYFPSLLRIARVEVFKGPSAILYGPQTIGGAINFLTREVPQEPSGEVDISYGRFWSRRLHLHYGTRNEWGGVLLEAVDQSTDGYKELDIGPDGNPDTGFQRNEFVLKGFVETDPEEELFQRVELKLGYGREVSRETYLGLTDADFRDNPDRRYAASQRDRMNWWRTQIALRHTIQLGEQLEVTSTAYRHDFDRTWRRLNRFRDGPTLLDILQNPTGRREIFYRVLTGQSDSASVNDPAQDQEDLMIVANARRYVSQGVQSTGRLRFETGEFSHEVEAGLRFHYDEVDRDHAERGYRMQNGDLLADGRDATAITDNLGRTYAFAGYAVYGITFHNLTLSPGLRTEVIDTLLDDDLVGATRDDRNTILLPGLGAHYAFTEELGILAGVHRGFSPVSPGQPDDVDPETSVNYEVGARYTDVELETLAELIGFFNDYNNLTGECTGSTGCPVELFDRQFNGGGVHVLGLEAAATHQLKLGSDLTLPVRGSYTFTHATFRNDFDSDNPQFGGVERGDELPYVPRHQAQLQVGVERVDAFSSRVSVTYVGAMREEAGQGDPGPDELPRTDDYFMIDVVGGYQLFEDLEMYLRLENVLNSRPIVARRPFGARPTRPFSIHLGLKAAL